MKKECRKCGEIKPIEDFRKIKLCRDGRGHSCKKCINIYQTLRRQTIPGERDRLRAQAAKYRAENPEKSRKYITNYMHNYKKDPKVAKRLKDYAHEYMMKHIDRVREQCRDNYWKKIILKSF
jgi:hypothetical protein